MSSDDADSFPHDGRIAAVDYGTVRIGVAICDADRILASPLEIRQVQGSEADGLYFQELAQREHISGFVVGLPIHCDGGESQKSHESRSFARWLSLQTQLPVRLFDERFTTSAAKERLRIGSMTRKKRKGRLDAVAALVLLESFLEAARYLKAVPGQSLTAPAAGGQGLDE